MIMHNVKSSNIKAIGYNGIANFHKSNGTLRIEFSHGGIYNYENVPFKIASDFLKAESLGKYFHKHINNKYVSVRQN